MDLEPLAVDPVAIPWDRLALVLAVTVAVTVALAWAARRFMLSVAGPRRGGRQLRVLETLAVGRDRSLLLVEVRDRVLLVGLAGQFTMLTELDPSDEGPAHEPGAPPGAPPVDTPTPTATLPAPTPTPTPTLPAPDAFQRVLAAVRRAERGS